MPNAFMRLLMIIGVLLCSMHVAEPVAAHSTTSEAAFHFSADDDDQDRQEPASELAHNGHHHCPVAPDLKSTSADTALLTAGSLLFAAPVKPFTSRVLPPLLDPPLLTI